MQGLNRFEWVRLTLILSALGWGGLAFGAVYPWAFWPLAGSCAVAGVLGLFRAPSTRHVDWRLAALLGLAAVAALAQLMPLDAIALGRVSPATLAFLTGPGTLYAVALHASPQLEATGLRHPLSVDPHATSIAAVLLLAFGAFLIGTAASLSDRLLRRLVEGVTIIGVVVALAGIVQSALPAEKVYGFWEPHEGGRPFGPFVNRNHFAGWMLMAIPLVLGYFGARVVRGMRRGAPGLWGRLRWFSSSDASRSMLVGFAVLVMAISLVLTMSRSGLVCLGASLALMLAVVWRSRSIDSKRVVVGSYVALVLVTAVSSAGFESVLIRFDEADTVTLGGRLALWTDTVHVARDFPWTGTGLNTFASLFPSYQTFDFEHTYTEAHNDYLQLAAEGGLLVGIPAAVAALTLGLTIRRRFREAVDSEHTYWIRLGAVMGICAIAMQEIAEFSLQIPGNTALFALLCAIAIHKGGAGPSRAESPLGARRVVIPTQLWSGASVALFLSITLTAACGRSTPRVEATYDKQTGKLTRLAYDSNNNGKMDTWTYMDGTKVLRVEIDKDEDGKIDRWEYYGPDQKLEKVGISRANDGKPDTWIFAAPDGSIGRMEVSTRGDGKVNRVEYYEKGVLVRAEEDSDGDGKIDKWEAYTAGALASVAFDTQHRGHPDRRLVYRADGTFDRLEVDAGGTGTFELVPAAIKK